MLLLKLQVCYSSDHTCITRECTQSGDRYWSSNLRYLAFHAIYLEETDSLLHGTNMCSVLFLYEKKYFCLGPCCILHMSG